MSNPYFSFKEFTVYHDKCAMKVGIDGVLLGTWAEVGNSRNILDIGTGTGLIALMIAQRSGSETIIDAIDIDKSAVLQARENIQQSPWSERIRVYPSALQQYKPASGILYDLIVSNPPYFVNSLKTPSKSRSIARHTDTLSHEELIDNAAKLLSPKGRICLILPVDEGRLCAEYASKINLFCTKQVTVFPKPNAAAKRLLLELSKIPDEKIMSELTIETEIRNRYTDEFTLLAKDYYLKL